MSQYSVRLETNPAPTDIEVIQAGLVAFNRSAVQSDPGDEFEALSVFVRAIDGTVKGGLLGRSWWGWLYINIVWMHDDLRGQHFGTQLMQMAEQEGVKRGCHSVFLDTHDFQALPFYQKLGYTVFGELEDFPPGYTRYYLKKRLMPSAAPQIATNQA